MKHPCFLKILPWFKNNKKKSAWKGSMVLISTFMLVVFSTLGLSMLYFSQIHIKLTGYKKNSMILEYASENGIKRGVVKLAEMIEQSSSPEMILKEEVADYLADTKNNGPELINKLFGCEMPIVLTETWENLKWDTNIRFPLTSIQEQDSYFSAAYRTEVISEGMLINFGQKKKSVLKARLEIAVGNLPLPFLPFHMEKIPPDMGKEDFLRENNISISPSSQSPFSPGLVSSGEGLIPENTDRLMNKAFKINMFYPQKLSNAQIRNVLGLEICADPVPEGVYLIQDDMGLGGIYVQGDVIEFVLAIEMESQVISFQMEQGCWVLKYDPARTMTWFSTPTETSFYELKPLGIIIVEGDIQSLGGGIIDSSGKAKLVKDKEIPCILNGVDLTIISSNEITLSSHLLHEGVKWEEGIPYAKDSTSQLNIFSSSGIKIHEDAPDKIKLQASLTAAKNGFSIEGEDKDVSLMGNLHMPKYESNGNSLELFPDRRQLQQGELLQNAPVTANPVIALLSFKIIEWSDYEN
jgi:hypothetical protein